MSITPNQAITLFIWFMLAILLVFLLLIARFYEATSRERTFYWAFIIPIVLFGIASVRDAFNDQVGNDILADGTWFVGGAVLIALCSYLYRVMTTGRK